MLWLFTLAMLAQDPASGTITVESSVELETVVRDGRGEATRFLTLNRKDKFKQTKVDGKTVRIECLASTLQKSGSDTPIEEKSTALAGQTYVSTRTENGWVVTDADGGSPPVEGRNLGSWNTVTGLLPQTGEIKAGDKWTVENKDLVALIFPSGIKDATGKLECACESVDGGKAVVTFSGAITGHGKEEGQGQISLSIKSGRLTYDLAKKAPSAVLMSGSLESATDVVDVVRKPGVGQDVGNTEDKRKIGEIVLKTKKLEMALTFE